MPWYSSSHSSSESGVAVERQSGNIWKVLSTLMLIKLSEHSLMNSKVRVVKWTQLVMEIFLRLWASKHLIPLSVTEESDTVSCLSLEFWESAKMLVKLSSILMCSSWHIWKSDSHISRGRYRPSSNFKEPQGNCSVNTSLCLMQYLVANFNKLSGELGTQIVLLDWAIVLTCYVISGIWKTVYTKNQRTNARVSRTWSQTSYQFLQLRQPVSGI